ncbi:MAG: Glycine cleavage system transcriptional activator [Candidatus Celerinatantimonas neptuna]|nr:MAG: Glycine cleavage system transcriptional activator [Candidatus Celerinatantimonas neptuna]
MNQLPSLKALQAFEVIARLGSIGAAAREIHVTQAAMSHQLQNLEKQLGAKLFERGPKGVSLTDIAQRYLPIVHGSLHHLRVQTQLLFSSQQEETLTIRVNHTLSYNWLIPKLDDFFKRFPFIHLDLQQVDWPSKYPCRDAEIELTNGFSENSDIRAERLFQESWILISNQSVLNKYQSALKNKELSSIPMIQVKGYAENWLHWLSYNQLPLVLPNIRLEVSNSLQALQAVKCGLGVALIRSLAADIELKEKQVVLAMDHRMPTDDGHYLITARRRSAKVNFFCEWLSHQVEHFSPL